MINRIGIVALVFFVTLGTNCFCSTITPPSDSLTLDTININGHKYQAYNSLNLFRSITQEAKFQTLGDLVSGSGISIRSNGVGQLTLASVRGLYGNQLNLLWEGVNIQSPMNGNFDLSLIPGFLIDKASILQNNHSSMSGNSALSGSIVFGSENVNLGRNQYSAYFSMGSFNSYFGGVDVILSNKNKFSRSRLFYNQSENDYPILGYEQTPFRKRQVNNDFKSFGILQEYSYTFKSNGVLSLKAWLQQTDRGLTETISVPNPRSRQVDDVIRLYSDFVSSGINTYYIKTAFFDEKIVFTDNQFNEYHNHAQTIVMDFSKKWRLGLAGRLTFGINETLNKGIVKEYNGIRFQNLFSGFISYENKYKKLHYTFSLREQLHNAEILLPAPSIEFFSFLTPKMKIRMNSGLSYRVSTFNDLYWTPGGNQALLNETAFKNEIGFDYIQRKLKFNFSIYYNEISNLIVWMDNGSFWEAENLRGARVLGTEINVKTLLIDRRKTQLILGVFASLNHSVYTKTEIGNRDIKGNQLIFIPIEMGNAYADFQFNRFSIGISDNYTGKRFISTDNSSFLNTYNLVDIKTSYKYQHDKSQGEIGFSVNNVFNTPYELFKGRPMQGRSYRVYLILKIN
ncbi:MAG: TonB-dependent receptor [Bacteroidia bacterium]|nr:TonB-dependent receptor [Bacteroidia bacterium]